ncbi:hypothetical protein CANINC_004658 [Pichia inconspicua]|uniref:Vacuolar protein sorting-associated protein 55 n=1 Tax=Pichia inconspicua TaxID=52247 RepID=A0A4T0WVW3_9ASCO|nr:hypothetical protein CANINC_004658 [[Candida] inconspicua]
MPLTINPLSKIIGLSGMLALGFLLLVLSTALYGSWMPILDGFIFGIAHLPYLISNGVNTEYETGLADVSGATYSAASDFGKWFSSFLLVSAVALPITLTRSHILTNVAASLSIAGGLCIYTTIVIFTSFFDGFKDSSDPFSV